MDTNLIPYEAQGGVHWSAYRDYFNKDISADGRFVAFVSYATNLVSGDTNGVIDIFVHDRATRTTERVSVASDGTQGNLHSWMPSVSADGRFVAFSSGAGNLVAGDNGKIDVFVHDRETGTTEIVSVSSTGVKGNQSSSYAAISADGRFVAFDSTANNLVPNDTNGKTDIFVYDRETDAIERVSVASDGAQGNGYCNGSAISPDGRFVVFPSTSDNIVPDDNTTGWFDIFVRDRVLGTTERVSVADDGSGGIGQNTRADISDDGRFVAFDSSGDNLVPGDTNANYDAFVHDREVGLTWRISLKSDGSHSSKGGSYAKISGNGRYVIFASGDSLLPEDTNGAGDVYLL